MESLLGFLEKHTIRILTHRKAVKAYEMSQKTKRTMVPQQVKEDNAA
ncbi:hypothetical protein [uncultured Sphaerochaeta sp.]|nr:hypothetical protein [uncultured Sphaerochaeta sp.]